MQASLHRSDLHSEESPLEPTCLRTTHHVCPPAGPSEGCGGIRMFWGELGQQTACHRNVFSVRRKYFCGQDWEFGLCQCGKMVEKWTYHICVLVAMWRMANENSVCVCVCSVMGLESHSVCSSALFSGPCTRYVVNKCQMFFFSLLCSLACRWWKQSFWFFFFYWFYGLIVGS